MCMRYDDARAFLPTRSERTSTRERYPLSRPFLVRSSSSPSRARDRAQDEAWNRGRVGHLFPCLSLTSPREYTTTTRRSRIKSLSSRERELSVDSDTRSARAIHPPFLLRGSYAAVGARARAPAPLREITAGYAVDPRAAAAAAARNRVNASPVVLLVSFI